MTATKGFPNKQGSIWSSFLMMEQNKRMIPLPGQTGFRDQLNTTHILQVLLQELAQLGLTVFRFSFPSKLQFSAKNVKPVYQT